MDPNVLPGGPPRTEGVAAYHSSLRRIMWPTGLFSFLLAALTAWMSFVQGHLLPLALGLAVSGGVLLVAFLATSVYHATLGVVGRRG